LPAIIHHLKQFHIMDYRTAFFFRFFRIVLFVSACLLAVSCVNSIPLDELPDSTDSDASLSGTIPIRLSVRLQPGRTRMNASSFESGDSIGLYMNVRPAQLSASRHVDNRKFTYSLLDEAFLSDDPCYFPSGHSLCDFHAYYPYRSSALGSGSSEIPVSVYSDQRGASEYAASLFLAAHTRKVAPSEDRVDLLFKHRLTLVHLHVKPSPSLSFSSAELQGASVRLKNVALSGHYDFSTEKFRISDQTSEVLPHGSSFSLQGEMYTGLSVVLPPQTLRAPLTIAELTIADRVYECVLSADYTLIAGHQDNLILTLSEAPVARAELVMGVDDWTAGSDQVLDGTPSLPYVTLSEIDFSRSHVYHVCHEGKPIAEICREYLRQESAIDAQAVVVYPYDAVRGVADWSSGLVCELTDTVSARHGGSVAWQQPSKLTYTVGSQAIINRLYFTKEKTFQPEAPASAISITLRPVELTDTRGDETCVYPIVKIGTQYWLRSNLRATRYVDEVESGRITQVAEYNTDEIARMSIRHSSPHLQCFYNRTAVDSGDLAPAGWRIGSEIDWGVLATYTGSDVNNAASLKSGGFWDHATNLTGFNGYPTGYYVTTYDYGTTRSLYWSMDGDNRATRVRGLFRGVAVLGYDKVSSSHYAAGIRCVKE
jgi:uncharacterized protein (TIGR02145 family)